MSSVTLEALEEKARSTVDAVSNDPAGRVDLRRRYYARWGGGETPGFGRAEIDFLEWEVARGVLAPIASGGSAWWRAVNSELLYHAELASLIAQHLPDAQPGSAPVRMWLEYQKAPSSRSWYRAHNASIVSGYLSSTTLAHREPWSERVFINIVLYRLLYAQALVEGVELGELGAILADPRTASVDLILDLPAFYPRNYVLSREDVRDILQRGHTLTDDLASSFDDFLVIPQLDRLYAEASGWIEQPGLSELVLRGRPLYPLGIPSRPADRAISSFPPETDAPRKIAILGGGLASLAAAYELTNYPGWRNEYEVTLYQVGFRLGGKTACGLGPCERIEERGIHIFQGWYHNAFRMVRDAFDYMEKHQLNEGSPLRTWDQAFVPDPATLFTQYDKEAGVWRNWPVLIPFNDLLPGEGGPPPLFDVIGEAIGLFAELVLGSPYDSKRSWLEKLLSPLMIDTWFTPPWHIEEPDWWHAAKSFARSKWGGEMHWARTASDLVRGVEAQPMFDLSGFEISALRLALFFFGGFVALLRRIAPADREADNRIEHIYVLAEFALANLRGFVEDVYDETTHTTDFGRINAHDYREWLLSHGLPQDLADCAPVRFIYCGAFHNQYQGAPGRLAADMGIRSLIASVAYRGSLVWKLVGGTGGSLTAPIYKMLEHRGVKFEFFHQVEEIHWSPGSEIEAVTIGVQVDLDASVSKYAPLEKSEKGIDSWPSVPHYAQLDAAQAAKLQAEGIDLEDPWSGWSPVRTKVLQRGRDFDEIISGIPVRAMETVCKSIIEHSAAWRDMASHVRTTPTFGVQLWLRPGLPELGLMVADWGMPEGNEPNSVIYEDLLYSWTDMNCVLESEGWKPDVQPGELSYYCGTWPVDALPPFSDREFPRRERKRLMKVTRDWLDANMGWFFPKAIKDGRFDLTLLVDPNDPGNERAIPGEERFANQWFVVNIAPSEQYTLAWPGSDRFRFKADQSGFDNLFLCGDWTDFGLNIGHVEGAVTSGILAAQSLLSHRIAQPKVLRAVHPAVRTLGTR